MTPSPKPLGRHIAPALDEARLERQIAAIVKRGAPRRPVASSLRRQAVAAAVCLVVGGSVAWRLTKVTRAEPTEPTLAVAGTTVETRAGGETITLADGSRAVLAPKSKLTLMTVRPDIVRVALEEGGVDLDVVHAEGKEFVVVARGYEIRVLGTRFRVRLLEGAGAASLEVEVARGRVRVTHAGKPDDADLRVLGAGETWTATLDAERPVSASAPAIEASADTAPVPRPAAVGAGGAKELLARAEASRAANDPRGAARLFDALRAHHRSDPRAGLAAFELGRLRLDRLGDPRGAAEALSDALSIAPGAPFREDAQARLVEAYEASGDHARCLDARAGYLARYPRGVHRGTIASRCGE
jgi:FecR-like protein